MYADIPVGNQHPLQRKQLQWLLIILAVFMIAIVVTVLVKQSRVANVENQTPAAPKQDMTANQEEIEKKLEALAAENPAPQPTQEEIEKKLEALAAESPAPQPTQEEIQKQLEMLSKQ